MNPAGRSRPGRLDTAGPDQAGTLEPQDPAAAGAADAPADYAAQARGAAGEAGVTGPAGAPPPAGAPAAAAPDSASHPVLRHLALLAVYLAAGIALTWPRASYLARHRLPKTRDVSGYVWDLWWTAHQVAHLGNPWFTGHMAAPVGIQLGFDTTMPLAGLIMTPVTLAFGPSASFSLLTIVLPGLLCYVMYRAARLWLAAPGAVAAGALFGLSSMLAWQDWYHLNIALGSLFLPLTLETAILLRRRPGLRQGAALGVVLGASVLINQESAVMAVLLAAAALLPWLAGRRAGARAPALRALAAGAAAALVVASPQLIAMIQQAASGGGASEAPAKLAASYDAYGASLNGLFAPSPQVARYGLHGLATAYSYRIPTESVETFGLVLTVLALCGLAASWRRRSAWLLAVLWLGGAALALGSTLVVGNRAYVPLAETWNGTRLSLLLPYTWLVHVPGLSALREADRLALLGLLGAAMLAGAAVDWLRAHAWPAIIVVAVLALLEAGWTAPPSRGLMPTAMPALDRPIAADHSGSIVLDIPFGLRGGLPLYGSATPKPALLLATADGHPRAISYTSWVPRPTAAWFARHAFYVWLVAAQDGRAVPAARLAAARRDVRGIDIGWVLVWSGTPARVVRFLTGTGFVFDYRADHVSVYRPGWRL
jgi:hypothetical protein